MWLRRARVSSAYFKTITLALALNGSLSWNCYAADPSLGNLSPPPPTRPRAQDDNLFAEKAGISSLLAEHGLSSEVAAAVSWCRTAGADTLRDVVEAGLQEDFVESLGFGEGSLLVRLPVLVRSYFGGLSPIKKGKLIRALQRMGGDADVRRPKDDL